MKGEGAEQAMLAAAEPVIPRAEVCLVVNAGQRVIRAQCMQQTLIRLTGSVDVQDSIRLAQTFHHDMTVGPVPHCHHIRPRCMHNRSVEVAPTTHVSHHIRACRRVVVVVFFEWKNSQHLSGCGGEKVVQTNVGAALDT